MKNLMVLLMALTILGCKNTSHSTDINEIISFMIDRNAEPLPPPPPVNDTTTVISKKTIDSLVQVKLKVALYPKTDVLSENELKRIPKKYRDYFNPNGISFKKRSINGITSKKNHSILLADTTALKKSKDFNDFDLLFQFSNFYFSNNNQEVLFSLGVSRSQLWGTNTLYILKKENKKWKIEYSKYVSEW